MSQQVLVWLSRVYSRPDKAPGGSPAPGMQEHRLIQAVLWEVSSQALAATVRSPFYLESCGAGTLSCTPVPWAAYPGSANPRAEPILMGAQEERAVLGLRHIAGTCHPLPPRLWGDREEVLLVGH